MPLERQFRGQIQRSGEYRHMVTDQTFPKHIPATGVAEPPPGRVRGVIPGQRLVADHRQISLRRPCRRNVVARRLAALFTMTADNFAQLSCHLIGDAAAQTGSGLFLCHGFASHQLWPIFNIMKRIILALCGAFLASPVLAAPCDPSPGAVCRGHQTSSAEDLLRAMKAAEIVILGERHDNPIHHRTQAEIVALLAPKGLAFEMIKRADEDAANAGRTGWENETWSIWDDYRQIIEAAPDAKIAGGGLSRDTLRSSVKLGAAVAWGDKGRRYRLLDQLPMDVTRDMIEEQRIAHCDGLPKHMLPGMVEAQQLRDAAFADAALRLVEAGHIPTVLITGNGHARTDRGSPLYLRRAAPDVSVISVGIIESGDKVSAAPFDYTIYTEPFDRGDPCADFLKSRKKDQQND